MSAQRQDQLKKIRLLVLDVDGVLSDGSIIFSGDDTEIKAFNVQDGFGITMARQAGLQTAILTGRVSPPVKRRAAELKFDFYEAGHFNKEKALLKMMEQANVTRSQVLYMGDDILDLVLRPHVGLFVAPANANERVRGEADWTTEQLGGHGAVREMIDFVLQQQGVLETTENYFIKGGS